MEQREIEITVNDHRVPAIAEAQKKDRQSDGYFIRDSGGTIHIYATELLLISHCVRQGKRFKGTAR